ncbi:hypothetical protein [Paracidovorax konjaci]|uniref:hypothetical protein n=1 Tax=Paracidovorax konjaci TaxID=32040 RepID=UPI00111357FB|nr:hypothetical protein [Paracidovorax konjaci]
MNFPLKSMVYDLEGECPALSAKLIKKSALWALFLWFLQCSTCLRTESANEATHLARHPNPQKQNPAKIILAGFIEVVELAGIEPLSQDFDRHSFDVSESIPLAVNAHDCASLSCCERNASTQVSQTNVKDRYLKEP